ncbi:MAG: glycerophosphodiester phosphodiesterase, partial [Spirochaetaceae bacterium]|nr:glycerophosphodiester phosphodiesterase [Spirochaetaceae bacterium]
MSRIPLLPERSRPLLFAHRGCSSLAPENTWASYRRARELGAPGLELDVHLCATGELVVAHDDNFHRTAPSAPRGNLEDLSWEEIRTVDVGSFFGPGFGGERCPLLQDILEEFCPELYVDIELKTRKTSGDALPARTAELLRSLGPRVEQAVTVSSFNPFALRAFRAACAPAPAIPTAIIYCVDPEVPWILRRGAGRFIAACDYAKPRRDQAGRGAVAALAGREKRPVVPWTVDDPAEAALLLDRGCEGIITNCPQHYTGG